MLEGHESSDLFAKRHEGRSNSAPSPGPSRCRCFFVSPNISSAISSVAPIALSTMPGASASRMQRQKPIPSVGTPVIAVCLFAVLWSAHASSQGPAWLWQVFSVALLIVFVVFFWHLYQHYMERMSQGTFALY